MRMPNRHNEKGIALILSILALLLLSAIAVGMMYMSTTEASVNANFKAEETEYFAARAGVEEVRDRMLPSNPNTINNFAPVGGVGVCAGNCLLPTALPNTAIGAGPPVLYILQGGGPGVPPVTMANVTGGTPTTNPLFDDEFCHDFAPFGGMAVTPNNVRCATLPAGAAWYSTPAAPAAGSPFLSAAPYPLDWKWARVTQKGNTSSAYPVTPAPAGAQWDLVCWNGSSEVTAPAGTPVAVQNNSPCGSLNPYANPVYLVTSLAVSPSGARRLVQQELAQTPARQPSGLFATGTGCAALSLAGGAKTFAFNSATEAGGPTDPPSNVTIVGADIGSNGNVDVSGAGTIVNGATLTNDPTTWGNCNQGNGVSGNGTYGTAIPPIQPLPTSPTAYTPPTPPAPNPMPPTTNCNNANPCWNTGTNTLSPGSYGNVSLTGGTSVTLQGGVNAAHPAVYTLNSISVNPGCNIVITGPVILNIAGAGQQTAVDIQGFANNTNIAGNFVINYGGSANVKITSANAGAFAVINAPNANVNLTGNANFYGQIVGATISDTGGASFYWDKSADTSPVTNPYYEISMRELSY